MARTKKQAHDGPHKYKRIDWNKPVYKCVLPGCNHYQFEELIEGAISVCWRQKPGCMRTVLMDRRTIGLVKPHCEPCTRGYVRKGQGADPKPKVSVNDRLDALIEGLEVE